MKKTLEEYFEGFDLNPATKQGDKILLLASRNGISSREGHVFEVTQNRSTRSKSNFNVVECEHPERGVFTMYYTTPADTFVMFNRDAEILYTKYKIEELQELLEEHTERLEMLTKYASEEEYVAAKLDSLFTAYEKGNTKEDRVKLMSETLKQLKKSNML